MAEDKLTYKFQHVSETENGEAVPVEARSIELTGKVIHFSLNEILGDLVAFDKKLKELEGMRKISAAKITNIERQHPFVKDFSESDRLAVYLYHEALAMVKATDKHTTVILEEKAKALAEVADIKAQIPELADIPVDTEPMPESGSVGTALGISVPKEVIKQDANTTKTSSGEKDGGADTQADETQETAKTTE